jgi:hypothetical protein
VEAIDDNNIPIQDLKAHEFQIKTTNADGEKITLNSSRINFISSQQSQPDPAYIVILLDMTGSMRQNDLAGKNKQESAINAIREVIHDLRVQNMPVQISVIPFGEGGKFCEGFKVNADEISRNLVKVSDSELDRHLDALAAVNVCASTQIYEPLGEAVMYLGNTYFEHSSNQLIRQNTPPRLGVILLSDGYDAYRSDETERFQDLMNILQQNPQVTVHTIGYGETLRQLRDRSNCNLSNSQLTVDNVSRYCQLSGTDIREFIIDEKRLNQIAEATGGIYRLPGTAKEVVETLRTFLTTLREYEIIYQQPGSDRASQHQTTVTVVSSSRQVNLTSEVEQIRMSNFNYCPLPFSSRFSVLAGTLSLLGLPGFLLFLSWSKKLKSQAEEMLRHN